MGDLRRPPEPNGSSGSSREIPSEMLQEILMKLPAKDVARSCCVSRQWRGVASDPSFHSLHAASYVAPWADAQVLLITQSREPDEAKVFFYGKKITSASASQDAHNHDEASVYSMSTGSAMAMCSVAIPSKYSLANVCNGLLCFAHRDKAGEPAVVCNPVTGETLALPRAPPLPTDCIFALGFSPPKREYKLFRLSSPSMDVYTLGDGRGWRQHTHLSLPRPTKIMAWAPQLIDGKLYMLTSKQVLVVDVSTETCRTYHLPDDETLSFHINGPLDVEHAAPNHGLLCSLDTRWVGAFELDGQLCFAMHGNGHLRGVHVWVMSPPPEDDKPPQWDLRYSFRINAHPVLFAPWSAWVDDGEMLCYMQCGTLYMYSMRACSPPVPGSGRWLEWNQQLKLAEIPLWWRSSECRWNIQGGYRPTLLSPLVFTLPPTQDDEDK